MSPNQKITTDSISKNILNTFNFDNEIFSAVISDTQEIIDKLFEEGIFKNMLWLTAI